MGPDVDRFVGRPEGREQTFEGGFVEAVAFQDVRVALPGDGEVLVMNEAGLPSAAYGMGD